MKRRLHVRAADLRGAARLATDATAGLTDLVEAVHERIARFAQLPGFGAPAAPGRTGGITGLVYKSIRGVARGVGSSVDALLARLTPALAPGGSDHGAALPSAEREAIVAALNGVLGDHLAATDNPLASAMALRSEGRALVLENAALKLRLPSAGTRLVVLLHGLCMNDLQWRRKGHDHGAALAHDCGYTPVYLHYNSGLHISANGLELAGMLQRLLDAWPQPLERVVLLGHSMGGLLARSALHQGALAGQAWGSRISDLVCLGTPHHGAPLERAGHGIDVLLDAAPYAAPFARLGKLRSAGITDLRHGNLLEGDWAGADQFARGADRRLPVPLPAATRCHALAASLGTEAGDLEGRPVGNLRSRIVSNLERRLVGKLKRRFVGDGLVPLDSALGRHEDPARTLGFPAERQWTGHGMNHLDLLSRPEVYAQLRAWLL